MKKNIIALTTVLLCLLASVVSADTKPLADRFDPGLPPGLVARTAMHNGCMDILIDTHATDWDMVATSAKKSGSLTIHPGIHAPEKKVNGMWEYDVQGAAFSTDIARLEGESMEAAEQRVLNDRMPNGPEAYLQNKPDAGRNGSIFECSYQGWSIGSYDEGTGLFLPMSIEQGWASFAVCWRTSDESSPLLVERMRFNVRFTDMVPIYTSRRSVKEADIKTCISMNPYSQTEADGVRATPTDGCVVYEIPNIPSGVEAYVHTAIAAPYDADWKAAYLLGNGREQKESGDKKTTEWTLRDDGLFDSGKQYIVPYFRIEKSDILEKKDWAIKWVRDEDGREVTAVTGLEAVFRIGNPQFTASYPYKDPQTGWQKEGAMAIPEGRLRCEIANPLSGLSVMTAPGHIHMEVDEDKLPPNRKTNLSQTTMSARVKAPDNAKSFNVYYQRGDIIYGNWSERQRLVAEGIPAPGGEWMSVPDFTDRSFFKAYSILLQNGKYITYYIAPTFVGRYGGETLIFEWTLEDGSQLREYVTLTMDAYQIRRNSSMTMNPNNLVEIPTVQANRLMVVETAMLPQMGENVIRHEITLYDNDGDKQELKQPVALYLPYPDGKTMAECEKDVFVVYHQVGKDDYEEFSAEKGNLTLTPYGLRMEVTSFSPYYLSWEAGVNAEELPQTGDHSKPAMWLLLAFGAVVACINLNKKKAAC